MPAAQLAVLGSTAVLVVPILDHFSGKRKVGMTTIFAALLACLGTILLQSEGEGSLDRRGVVTWRQEKAFSCTPPVCDLASVSFVPCPMLLRKPLRS